MFDGIVIVLSIVESMQTNPILNSYIQRHTMANAYTRDTTPWISTDLLFFLYSCLSLSLRVSRSNVRTKTAIGHMALRPKTRSNNGEWLFINFFINNFQSDSMQSHMRRMLHCCTTCIFGAWLRSSRSDARDPQCVCEVHARVSISQFNLREFNFNSSSSFRV